MGAVALSCTPAAIAISGSSLQGSAAQAQYPAQPTPPPAKTPGPAATSTPVQEVSPTATASPAPTTPPGVLPPDDTPEEPEVTVSPEEDEDRGTPTRTTEQGATPAAASSLPFTGGPVLPLLVTAFVLLGFGAVLRRAGTGRPTD